MISLIIIIWPNSHDPNRDVGTPFPWSVAGQKTVGLSALIVTQMLSVTEGNFILFFNLLDILPGRGSNFSAAGKP